MPTEKRSFGHQRIPYTMADQASSPLPLDSNTCVPSSDGLLESECVQEKQGNIIYSVCWSDDIHRKGENGFVRYLATCSTRYLSIYEVEIFEENKRAGPLILKQSYVDEYEVEDYYVCAFGGRSPQLSDDENRNENEERPTKLRRIGDEDRSEILRQMHRQDDNEGGAQLLCAGGLGRTIKVIDTERQLLLMTLEGHGDEILDLKFSPVDEWMLVSASKDESCRLWNVQIGSCLAIFAGYQGHRDSVVSIAWHPSGHRFASAGMDTTIRIWNLEKGSSVHKIMMESRTMTGKESQVEPVSDFNRNPLILQFPMFTTGANKIHLHCVDCIEFVGDLILSKSLENQLVLWYPEIPEPSLATPAIVSGNQQERLTPPIANQVRVLRTWTYRDGDCWYLRFATDPAGGRLAVGNMRGEIYVWKIGSTSTEPLCKLSLWRGKRVVIRDLAFSPLNGNILVAVADNGTLWKWDINSIASR